MRRRTKTIISSVLAALSLLGVSVCGASLVLPEANVFYTSFEEPDYTLGSLYGQNGWVRNGSTVDASGLVVAGGTDGDPAAPAGNQMAKLLNAKSGSITYGGAPYASLKFTNTPLTEKLYFSAVTGFSGTISESTGLISRFYLNNSTDNFFGAAFGIHQDGGELRFFTMFPGGTGNATAVSFGTELAQENVFYRFEVDMDIIAKSYEIRVYDYVTNELLASSDEGRFRGDRAATIDYVRLGNSSNPATNGDDFVTYYDEIWISTNPIPEPSLVGVFVGAAALAAVVARRRLRVIEK